MRLLDVLKPQNQFNDEEEVQETRVEEPQTEEKVRSFAPFRNKKPFESEGLGEMGSLNVNYDPDIFVNKSEQVKICKPKSYESVESIGQAIKDQKVVILHMDKLDPNVATRILEFVYGMCFYAGIEPENVDSKIIMIDPKHKRR
jgi:FtsZ-interacting cell division protein YlmF